MEKVLIEGQDSSACPRNPSPNYLQQQAKEEIPELYLGECAWSDIYLPNSREFSTLRDTTNFPELRLPPFMTPKRPVSTLARRPQKRPALDDDAHDCGRNTRRRTHDFCHQFEPAAPLAPQTLTGVRTGSAHRSTPYAAHPHGHPAPHALFEEPGPPPPELEVPKLTCGDAAGSSRKKFKRKCAVCRQSSPASAQKHQQRQRQDPCICPICLVHFVQPEMECAAAHCTRRVKVSCRNDYMKRHIRDAHEVELPGSDKDKKCTPAVKSNVTFHALLRTTEEFGNRSLAYIYRYNAGHCQDHLTCFIRVLVYTGERWSHTKGHYVRSISWFSSFDECLTGIECNNTTLTEQQVVVDSDSPQTRATVAVSGSLFVSRQDASTLGHLHLMHTFDHGGVQTSTCPWKNGVDETACIDSSMVTQDVTYRAVGTHDNVRGQLSVRRTCHHFGQHTSFADVNQNAHHPRSVREQMSDALDGTTGNNFAPRLGMASSDYDVASAAQTAMPVTMPMHYDFAASQELLQVCDRRAHTLEQSLEHLTGHVENLHDDFRPFLAQDRFTANGG